MRSLLCAIMLIAACSPCLAASEDGVLATERVINLPADQGKWYVSVVGLASDRDYHVIDGWFTSHEGLAKLRAQSHYNMVSKGTSHYNRRYAGNVKALPTVRVQDNHGIVMYEAAAGNLPVSAEAMYAAIALSANKANGIRPILPWRRKMENRCPVNPPAPPTPPAPPNEPPPELSGGGAPEIAAESESSTPLSGPAIALLAIAAALLGAGGSVAVRIRNNIQGR